MGHSTLAMVKQYVKLGNRDVALQHRRYSRVDNLGPRDGGSRSVLFR